MRNALLLLTVCAALLGGLAPPAATAGDVGTSAGVDTDAGRDVRVRQRRGTGFGLTAAGALPVLLGALLADVAMVSEGAPLLAAGVALGATGEALMMPWEQLRPRPRVARDVRVPTLRVSVAYRQGGVKIGVVGRF